MAVASMERIIGFRTIDHNGFSADFLRGDAIKDQKDVLLTTTARLDQSIFGETSADALELSVRRLNMAERISEEYANPNSTSMVLYRAQDTQPGSVSEYKGYSMQQELVVATPKGSEVVLAWLVRALQVDLQDHGLGRFDIQQGLVRHEDARAIFHRTITPVSPWSVIKSGILGEDQYYPWLSLYNSSNPEGRRAQQIMYACYFILREAGIAKAKNPPDPARGVAVSDAEPNIASVAKEGHQPTADITDFMVRRLRTTPGGKDRVYGVGLVNV